MFQYTYYRAGQINNFKYACSPKGHHINMIEKVRSHLVKQLLCVIVKGFMGEHAFIIVDTVPCGVEKLTGKFTLNMN